MEEREITSYIIVKNGLSIIRLPKTVESKNFKKVIFFFGIITILVFFFLFIEISISLYKLKKTNKNLLNDYNLKLKNLYVIEYKVLKIKKFFDKKYKDYKL